MFSVKNFKEDFSMKSNGFISKFLVGTALVAINSSVGIYCSERGPNARIIYGSNYHYINSDTDRRGRSSRDSWYQNPCGRSIFQPQSRTH